MGLLGAVLDHRRSRPLFFWHLTTTQVWGLTPLQDQAAGWHLHVGARDPAVPVGGRACAGQAARHSQRPRRHDDCAAQLPRLRPGSAPRPFVPLTWFTLIVSILVCVIIGDPAVDGRARASAPVAGAARPARCPSSAVPAACAGSTTACGCRPCRCWITLVWTMVTLAAVSGPPPTSGADCWMSPATSGGGKSTYLQQRARRHVSPRPMRSIFRSACGCWCGCTAATSSTASGCRNSRARPTPFPGRPTSSWLQADKPGRYRGQCSEYCGSQHAHMSLEVVAQTRRRFRALASAPAPAGGRRRRPRRRQRGAELVEYRCGLCHQRARHPGRRAHGPGPHPYREPPHAGGGTAAEQRRALSRLDRESAQPQTRQSDAQSVPVRRRADAMSSAYLESLQ